MKWRKSPDELVARFDLLVPDDPAVERRKMFGYPCAFAGGNLFVGLHQENLLLRLPDDARAEFLEIPGAEVFSPMPGRTMREYVTVPPPLAADAAALRPWVRKALKYALSLPPKKPRAKKPSRFR